MATAAPSLLDEASQAKILDTYGNLPLSFEANQGQTDNQVKFLSRGRGYGLFLTATEALLVLNKPAAPTNEDAENLNASEPALLRLQLVGANPQPQVTGLEALPGKVNYFIGNDPAKWRTDAVSYAKVRSEDVYPGIDLVYYGNQQQLEYDFVVTAGANPGAIRLSFAGVRGMRVDGDGDLVLQTVGGEIRQRRPVIYQEVAGSRKEIAGGYVLKGQRQVGFEVGEYDISRTLVIDPVLVYSTYLGGSNEDISNAIAVDAAGNAYITGFTASTDFPVVNALQPICVCGDQDLFVAKLNPAGAALVYATYLGGSRRDNGFGITVDAAGSAYISGWTQSSDFPTVNAVQPVFGGGDVDAIIVKLNPAGSALLYSTYLGGSGTVEYGNDIAVDDTGSAYVSGLTDSANFPIANALQSTFAGVADAFAAKLSPAGSALVYSTYLGGSAWDNATGIVVDAAGNAYLVGLTISLDFPTTNALQPASGGSWDIFVTKLNPAGSALVYSTYLGGSADDYGASIALETAGNIYVTGQTASVDFPTANALQPILAGGRDATVAKLNPAGSALLYSTYLGGSADDYGLDVAVDTAGSAYVVGWTQSSDFPTVNAMQPSFAGGGYDAFIARFKPSGSSLVYATYYGGAAEDRGVGVALDTRGGVYLTGLTFSTDFPTANAFQPTHHGARDVFVAKLVLTPSGQIEDLIEAVEELVEAGVLNQGQGNALIVKLEAALDQLDHCNVKAAANQLQAFVDQVNGFIDAGILTVEQGQPLLEAAQAIINKLTEMVVVPPAGGRVVLSPQITLNIGPSTFADPVRVDCTPLAPLATDPLLNIGLFFELSASYLDGSPAQPGQPYTLTVSYDPVDVPAAVHEALLDLYSRAGSGWIKEPSSAVDTIANQVIAQPDHFSLWAVLAEQHPLYLPIILKTELGPPNSGSGN